MTIVRIFLMIVDWKKRFSETIIIWTICKSSSFTNFLTNWCLVSQKIKIWKTAFTEKILISLFLISSEFNFWIWSNVNIPVNYLWFNQKSELNDVKNQIFKHKKWCQNLKSISWCYQLIWAYANVLMKSLSPLFRKKKIYI